MIKFTTSLGDIFIEVYPDEAPITVENFVKYVEDGFYDGTIFHRVIPDFVVQGGGMEPGMQQKPTRDPIRNEADNGLKNTAGTLSMARTNDPDSATSQFFINLKNNEFLDFRSKTPSGWGYAVFAKVVDGIDVVDKMAQVKTTTFGPHSDVPSEDVVLIKAEVVE
ncbi:MAG: peptidyl-prolyl cis-trans isomerase [marine bacterium B5-7]|nr:MAG: peptidyl-prolyl cis-trans isomerase [marine bacterium B5-7]